MDVSPDPRRPVIHNSQPKFHQELLLLSDPLAPTMDNDTSIGRSNPITCEECKQHDSIYQCPRCNIRTCSLDCCLKHKRRLDCSGKRNRGEFLPLSRMTDGTVRSDYFFLEEVLNTIPRNNAKRPRTQDMSTGKRMKRLVQKAAERGITVQVMPPELQRHKTNTSWYCGPQDHITWKVEVQVYPQKQACHFSLSENDVNLMEKVAAACANAEIPLESDYKLFLMVLPRTSTIPEYVEILSSDSLKSRLSGMTVIEHPTIYCVPVELEGNFPTPKNSLVTEVSSTNEQTSDEGQIETTNSTP